jgi:hypothetical protein
VYIFPTADVFASCEFSKTTVEILHGKITDEVVAAIVNCLDDSMDFSGIRVFVHAQNAHFFHFKYKNVKYVTECIDTKNYNDTIHSIIINIGNL